MSNNQALEELVNTSEEPSVAENLITYVGIVLDESGSMAAARKETISGITEQIQSLVNGTTEGMTTFVTIVTFADNVSTLIDNINVNNLNLEVFEDEYHPSGMTAMYDAVGTLIERFKALPNANDENVSFLVVVYSDGQENASKSWGTEKLAELVQSVQNTNRWTITYTGANQDLSVVSKSLNLSMDNMASFSTASAACYTDAYAGNTVATSGFMRSRSMGIASMSNFYSGAIPDEDKIKAKS